jgi:predicted alpha/beta-hydrolase family hydrolase
MTRRYPAADPNAPLLVLAHGAGAGQDHPWMRRAAQALADRGVSVATFDFPYMAEGRHVPDKGEVLEEAFRGVWDTAADGLAPRARFAGGKSMGGRIASQAAARGLFAPPPAGLVFFGYPLHPPGKPAQRRDRHLPSVGAPMLFLHGTKDPFGAPDEVTELVATLPNATLVLTEGGDHSLARSKRQDPEGLSLIHAVETAVAWIRNVDR